MLVFVIPLKSPKVSSSWDTVSKLFDRCARSVCNQTNLNFHAIVVCNEKPKIDFHHPNLTYIEQDFPLPGGDYPSKEFDRTRKMVTGIVKAKQLGASHIMAVDADDCVSNHLAEFVCRHPQKAGWFIKQGYYYQDGRNFVKVMRKGFDRYCGTSTIVRADLYDLPDTCDREALATHFYHNYRHREIKETLESKGFAIEPLPFKGAIYITETGENIYHGVESKKHSVSLKSRLLRIKSFFDNRFLTSGLREKFGLSELA
jgi:hypothetical protein